MWHYLKLIIRTLKVNCVETLRKALSPLQLWLGVMILFFWHVCIAFVLWHNYSGIIWYWRGMESCTCTRSLRPLSCHCSLFHQAAHPAVLLTLGRPSSGYCFCFFFFERESVLLLLSLKSRSLRPTSSSGRWHLEGIYSLKANMCAQLMSSFPWRPHNMTVAETLSCLFQSTLIKLSTKRKYYK